MTRAGLRRLCSAAASAAAIAVASEAGAEIRLSPTPLFGKDAPPGEAWSTVLARLESTESSPVRGVLEVKCEGAAQPEVTQARFSLAPGAAATLRVPVRGSSGFRLVLTARDEAGKQLATDELRTSGRQDPLLIDVHSPPRLVGAMRGVKLPVRYDPEGTRGTAPAPLLVGGIQFDPATGDPSLPEHAAEWGAATAVLMSSDTLSRLSGPELEALAGYVLGGGTLALVVRRPEDLRAGALSAMVGGEARDGGPARYLFGVRSQPLSREPDYGSGGGSGAEGGAAGSGGSGDDEPLPGKAPSSGPGAAQGPSAQVREGLVTYEGGNLVKSDFGATAAYGLGEVHLLAFDPTRAPGVDDRWVQSRVAELVRHAWDRRAAVVFPPGTGVAERTTVGEVRRLLDPNESARWAIVVAAILLLTYSVAAGPLNFSLATRAGKPLRALRNVPILSAAVFLAIVLVAVVSKGVRGEARRLSLVEASGGMTRGVIRRYRAFFTPRARELRVSATDASSVVDLTSEANGPGTLVAERGGVRLEGVTTLPWQTVVAREDGLLPLGGGVSLTHAAGGDVQITNRSARDLRGLIAQVPGKGYYFHASLRDGATVLASSGKLVTPSAPGGASPAGSMTFVVHPLGASAFEADLTSASRGLFDAWNAISIVGHSRQADWWPEGVPVVIAQIDGGEGVSGDEGLRVERDRLLLRVVGYGGAP